MARTTLAPDVGWRGRPAATPARSRTLARTCACGNHAAGGACPACAAEARRKRQLSRFADRSAAAGGSLLARQGDDASGNDGAREADDGVPAIVHEVLRGGGQPLSPDVRGFMEPRFGADFSDVRLHTDTAAAASSTAVSAQAYTSGSHIVFGAGRYQPGTLAGQHLLAHELTHVVQQRGASPAPATASQAAMPDAVSSPHDASEHEADATAARVLAAPAPAHAPASEAAEPSASAQASPAITQPGSGIQRLSGAGFLGIVGGLVAIDLIAGALGAFDRDVFPKEELKAYLDRLAQRRQIEGRRDSDNKARDIVRRYSAGDQAFDLDTGHQGAQATIGAVDLKRLLILEMLDNWPSDGDQKAILKIIGRTTGDDLLALMDPAKGLDVYTLIDQLQGENHIYFKAYLRSNFPKGSKVWEQIGENAGCDGYQAVQIHTARQAAIPMVAEAINALNQPHLPAVREALDCYFPGARPRQITAIQDVFQRVAADLPQRIYLCQTPAPDASGNPSALKCAKDGAAVTILTEPEVLICPRFYGLDAREQTITIIHEVAHNNGASEDVWEGGRCGHLPLQDALTDAESYARLAMALFGRVHMPPAPQAPAPQAPAQQPAPPGAGANQAPAPQAPGPQAPAQHAPFPPGAPQGEGVRP